MMNEEYANRILEIRKAINSLAEEMGAVYSTYVDYFDRIVKDARDADLIELMRRPNF